MNKYLRKGLLKFAFTRKMLHASEMKKAAFICASWQPFAHLGKQEIHRVYDEAFRKLFVLLDSLPVKGDIFEFGVFRGYSARLLATFMKRFKMDSTQLHLFDSFEGLPKQEALDIAAYEYKNGSWGEGILDVPTGIEDYIQAKVSKTLGRDVAVIKGFFDQTMESYFATLHQPKARLIYLDCDLYSSSKCVLEFLFRHQVIQDGTLIVFDDWMTSCGNPELGQRKATEEVLANYPNFSIEKYSNFGLGSHLFVVHDHAVLAH